MTRHQNARTYKHTHTHVRTAPQATGEAQTKRRLHLATRLIPRTPQKKWRLESAAYIHLVLIRSDTQLTNKSIYNITSKPKRQLSVKHGNLLIKAAH